MGWTAPPPVMSATEIGYTVTNGVISTTDPILPGVSTLILTPGGQGGYVINVVGQTSGIRYAWQAGLGQYAPVMVPIDSGIDTLFEITTSTPGGISPGALSVYATGTLPAVPVGISQVAEYNSLTYSGTSPEAVLASCQASNFFALDSLSWAAGAVDGATAAAVGYIYGRSWLTGGSVTLATVIGAVDGLSQQISTYPAGHMLQNAAPGSNAIYFHGNSSSTAFGQLSINATYRPL